MRRMPSVAEMVRACLLTLLSTVAALAQIGYPGQYPGGPPGPYPGGYPPGQVPGSGPGIPIPGRHKKQQDTESLLDDKGKVTEIGKDHFAIETTDHRQVTYAVTKETKFTDRSQAVSIENLGIGQTVDVQSRQGDHEDFTAVTVLILNHAGSPPANDASHDAADNGPPVIHRGSSEPSNASPAQKTADVDNTAAPTTIVQKQPDHTAVEADDGAPPVLHRGKPRAGELDSQTAPPETASNASSSRVETASVRTPPGDEDVAPASRAGNSTGEFLETARDTAEQFTENLPNFTCLEAVTRYYTDSPTGTAWQPIDVVTTKVVYEGGKESYQDLKVDGKKADPEKMGAAWSYGEFGTVLHGLFNPGLGASFSYRHDEEYNGFMSRMFDIEVGRERSNWTIHEGGQSYLPAYKGTVWIDKGTHRVVRIEMQAVGLPKTFPVDHAEMALDYQYVALGDHKFLVPVHSEVLMCHRGTPDCSKNVIDFRNYHKYGSETEINYGQ